MKMLRLIGPFILSLFLVTGASIYAAAPSANIPSLDIDTLRSEIESSVSKVLELQAIRDLADSLGVRCYLFGGSSAAFAHYVKWNTLRLQGHTQFIESRFDFDFTNIFHSAQDIDLVVDGSVEQAQALEAQLSARFSYFQGSRSKWEVRTLRVPIGNKTPLLNDYDFLNQHTDSHSTGLIEMTEGYKNDSTSVVRDLRDWDNQRDPAFLKDVADGKLNYYFSPRHKTTLRFKKGENPPIFSVVRYLTKAFQYGLEIRPEDLETIQRIVDNFNPKTDLTTDYARAWIEEKGYGSKLIRAAMDMEYAWNTLESLGLRNKLIAIKNNSEVQFSLAWWINKEPLRTKPVGKGNGRTIKQIAEEMGIPWEEFVIAHETYDYRAYESITRDVTSGLNVFISRKNISGEGAVFGNGFYNMIGRVGGRGTGLTIRSRMDPRARERTDFIVVGDMIILLNKAAAAYIPESLDLGPVEYFKILKETKFASSDRGILEQLRRRINNRLQCGLISVEEFQEIKQIVSESIQTYRVGRLPNEITEFLNSPFSKRDPSIEEKLKERVRKIIQGAIENRDFETLRSLVNNIPENWLICRPVEYFRLLSGIDNNLLWIADKFKQNLYDHIQRGLLTDNEFNEITQIVFESIQATQVGRSSNVITGFVGLSLDKRDPSILESFKNDLKKKIDDIIQNAIREKTYKAETTLRDLPSNIFSQPISEDWGELLTRLIDAAIELKSESTLREMAYVFRYPHSSGWGEQLTRLIDGAIRLGSTETLGKFAMSGTFGNAHAKNWGAQLSKLIEGVIRLKQDRTLSVLTRYTFTPTNNWGEQLSQLIEGAIQIGDRGTLANAADNIFSQPHSSVWGSQLTRLIDGAIELKSGRTLQTVASVFRLPHAGVWGAQLTHLIDAAIQINDLKTFSDLSWSLGQTGRADELKDFEPLVNNILTATDKSRISIINMFMSKIMWAKARKLFEEFKNKRLAVSTTNLISKPVPTTKPRPAKIQIADPCAELFL